MKAIAIVVEGGTETVCVRDKVITCDAGICDGLRVADRVKVVAGLRLAVRVDRSEVCELHGAVDVLEEHMGDMTVALIVTIMIGRRTSW